ncbi:MAG: hypothetical protein HC767_05780 [Akkermansiaceae bacterium]|nr:hypothetical protein [Akkermansiaceae bacterium]
MQALQTALVHAVIDGMPSYEQIQEVVVAELSGHHVEHSSAAQLLLTSIAPSSKFTSLFLTQVDAVSA